MKIQHWDENKMSTQLQNQHWNAGATEVQQLNLVGPTKDRLSIKPQPTLLKDLGQRHH